MVWQWWLGLFYVFNLFIYFWGHILWFLDYKRIFLGNFLIFLRSSTLPNLYDKYLKYRTNNDNTSMISCWVQLERANYCSRLIAFFIDSIFRPSFEHFGRRRYTCRRSLLCRTVIIIIIITIRQNQFFLLFYFFFIVKEENHFKVISHIIIIQLFCTL